MTDDKTRRKDKSTSSESTSPGQKSIASNEPTEPAKKKTGAPTEGRRVTASKTIDEKKGRKND